MNEIDIEQKLIAEIQCGNKKAEEELYHIYKNKLDRILRKNFPYNSEHEDDLSEILIKVFESIKHYDRTKSKFNSWVINIMKHYMIDKSKKEKPIMLSYSNSIINDNLDFSISSTTASINIVEAKEPTEYYVSYNPYNDLEIKDSLNYYSTTITASEFSMLKLKYIDGYDYKEIGTEFNLKDSQVSNKISYSKIKIKNNIKKGE